MNALERLRGRLTPIPDGHYLLGLSGGADSTALLLLLLHDLRAGRVRVEAVHVNHGIRGEAARQDAEFSKKELPTICLIDSTFFPRLLES